MTDMSKDAVERMDPRCDAGGHGYMLWMEYRDDGEYIRATDYDALAAKLAAAERRERQLLDTTATCRMLLRELNTAKAKLAEVEAERDAAMRAVDENWITHQRVVAAEAALPAVYRLALEDAEFACTNVIKNYDVTYDSGKKFAPMKTQKAAKGMVSIAREDIHALPTPTTAELMARIQTGEE